MFCVFFFSSRRRHTRFDCDWSSDVCSSDLPLPERLIRPHPFVAREVELGQLEAIWSRVGGAGYETRSEERRVGKSVDLGGRRIIKKKKKVRVSTVSDFSELD